MLTGGITLKRLQKLSLFTGSAILVVAFNNCGEGFIVDPEGASNLASSGIFAVQMGETCEAALMRVYDKTYHTFLNQNCGSCHTNGPGLGDFGSKDLGTSFASFMSVSMEKINRNAVNENHKPPATGAHNQARIDELTAVWAAAQPGYADCLSSSGEGLSGDIYKTSSKPVPANLGSTTFVRMEWDLEQEGSKKLPLVAGIEIRKAVFNTITRGYELRNPTLRLKNQGAGNYQARALNIIFEGKLYADVTTYSNIDYVIATATDFNLSPNTANSFIMTTPAEGQTIALDFSSLKLTTASGSQNNGTTNGTGPMAVPTFTQLVAPGGVFNTSCVGCHNANRADGGLNIADYNRARTAATNIRSRMNNPNNPMPRAGLLPQAQRDLVNAWISGGMPQ